jgi:hypothetical protein
MPSSAVTLTTTEPSTTDVAAEHVDIANPGLLSRWATAIRRHAYIVPSIAVATAVFAWFITWGTWDFLAFEEFSTFYDAHADGILRGQLDLSPRELAAEDFIVDGRHYGYFGPGPALLRIPLQLAFGRYQLVNGLGAFSWSRLVMTAAFAMSLAYAYALLVFARRAVFPGEADAARLPPIAAAHKLVYSLFILTAGLGSSALFMGSRSFVFHEAILLASAFTLACLYDVLVYLSDTRRFGRILAAGGWAALALQTRATTGAGAELGLLLAAAVLAARALGARGHGQHGPMAVLRGVARSVSQLAGSEAGSGTGSAHAPRPYWGRAILPAALAALGIASYMGFNYLKFHTLDGLPLQYYVRYIEHPETAKLLNYRQVHPQNIRATTVAYLKPKRIVFKPQFPWVYMRVNDRLPSKTLVLAVEPYSSITASSPAFLISGAVGLVMLVFARRPALRLWRVPAAAALAGGGIVLATVAISQRYHHDLYPALVIFAAVGLNAILVGVPRVRAARAALVALFVAGCAWSMWANAAFAIWYQRDFIWGVPREKQAEFAALRRGVDAIVGLKTAPAPVGVIETADGATPQDALPGELWYDRTRGTTLWYNGRRWLNPAERDVTTGGTESGQVVHCKVAFGEHAPAGRREPLVVSGRVGAADFVYAEHIDGGRMTIAFDHWGLGGQRSAPLDIVPGRLYDLSVRLGELNAAVAVWFDGALLFEHKTPVYPVAPGAIRFGENDISDLTQPRLNGRIFAVYERGRPRERAFDVAGASGVGAAFDGELGTEWNVARGDGGPVTVTLHANAPMAVESLYLVARAGGRSGWRRVAVRYPVGSATGLQEYALRELPPGGVQALKVGPVVTDRLELTFSDPVSDTPGYAEVIVGWK